MRHAIRREYPELLEGDSADQLRAAALGLVDASALKLALLAADWLRVGFCQGNFNADNCLVPDTASVFVGK